MTPTHQFSNESAVPSKVSILVRLAPSFSYVIAMLGAAVSAIFLTRVIEAMRNAESAGIAAVARGMAAADLAIIIALCLAVFVGFIGIVVIVIRAFMSTTTAAPSGWFFLLTGGLSLVPLLLLWKAQSILVEVLMGGNVSLAASTIQLCLTLTLVTSAAFALIILVASLVPLPSILRSKRTYAPIMVLVLMELALIGIAVAFQMRASWLYQVGIKQRF